MLWLAGSSDGFSGLGLKIAGDPGRRQANKIGSSGLFRVAEQAALDGRPFGTEVRHASSLYEASQLCSRSKICRPRSTAIGKSVGKVDAVAAPATSSGRKRADPMIRLAI